MIIIIIIREIQIKNIHFCHHGNLVRAFRVSLNSTEFKYDWIELYNLVNGDWYSLSFGGGLNFDLIPLLYLSINQ